MNQRSPIWRILAVALVCAAAFGAIMTYLAAQHHADGEFVGADGELSAVRLFLDAFVWAFVPVFVTIAVVGIGGYLLGRPRDEK